MMYNRSARYIEVLCVHRGATTRREMAKLAFDMHVESLQRKGRRGGRGGGGGEISTPREAAAEAAGNALMAAWQTWH